MRKLILALVFILLMGCDRGVKIPLHEDNNPGITKKSIIIGSSLPLSGHANYLGSQLNSGALAYINYVNDNGGIYGRKIDLVVYDDFYEPAQCLINTQKLIIDDKAFALFNYVGTPTTVRILPLVENAKIPIVGMFTGADRLRKPFSRYVINIRPSYYQETSQAVKAFVTDYKLDKFAVFYQYDAFGFDGLRGTEMALKKYSLEPIARGSYRRGSPNVDDAVDRISKSNPSVVFLIGTAKPCASFIKQMASKGLHPIYYTVSFTGASSLAQNLKDTSEHVIMSQVLPSLESINPSNTPHNLYKKILKRYYPDLTPNLVGYEGFINAQILVEGLRESGKSLSRNKFIAAIEDIKNLKLDSNLKYSFGKYDHQGLEKIYFTYLKGGKFIPVSSDLNLTKEADQ